MIKAIIHKTGKGTARRLAEALEWPTLWPTCLFAEKPVLNWGCSIGTFIPYLNKPYAVAKAVNKYFTLKLLDDAGIPVIGYTNNKAWAEELLKDHILYCRLKLCSSKGNGIVIVNPGDELPNAPLYTVQFPMTHEFRVHVFNGKIIDITQKRKRKKENLALMGLEKANNLIRNHKNGWIFSRNLTFQIPAYVRDLCIKAVHTLGLDFGAVDLLLNTNASDENDMQSWVICEVNTAPGLTGTTLERYVTAINSFVENL